MSGKALTTESVKKAVTKSPAHKDQASTPAENGAKLTLTDSNVPGSAPKSGEGKPLSLNASGRTSGVSSPRVGGAGNSVTGGKKKHTLIVQCPKCNRNVIVPGVLVFQCPCGQYMTIQKPDSPKIGASTPTNASAPSSTPDSDSTGKGDGPRNASSTTKPPQKSPLSKQTFPVSSPKKPVESSKKSPSPKNNTPTTKSKEN